MHKPAPFINKKFAQPNFVKGQLALLNYSIIPTSKPHSFDYKNSPEKHDNINESSSISSDLKANQPINTSTPMSSPLILSSSISTTETSLTADSVGTSTNETTKNAPDVALKNLRKNPEPTNHTNNVDDLVLDDEPLLANSNIKKHAGLSYSEIEGNSPNKAAQQNSNVEAFNVEDDSHIKLPQQIPVYDPDADRIEDLERSGVNEVINCCVYSRKTGEFIKKINIESVSDTLNNKKEFIWLGLYDPSIETINQVQKAFNLHELALEDAFNKNQRAKIESYGNDIVFVVVRTAFLESNNIHYGTTSMFMGDNYIITIRTGVSKSYAAVRAYCQKRPEKMRMGPIFVLHAVLDYVVDSYLPITDSLGEYLREQERNIFSSQFSKETLKRLYELKAQLVHMRAVMLPVKDICNFFINHKKTELVVSYPSSAKPYFRDVNDHLLRALDAVNGLNEMLSVAMDTYMAIVNMGQNEVVRKLAAWAGILAVPTAVAGIYGMNFDFMPELHYKYAYFVLLFLIFLACFILWRQFKKVGWL